MSQEYLTTLVHLGTATTLRSGDAVVTLRVSPAGVAFQERGNEADPRIDPAILDDLRQMPPSAGWMVGPWDDAWGAEPEAIPLYRLAPATEAAAAALRDSEGHLQALNADLAVAHDRIAQLEAELAALQGQLADLIRGQGKAALASTEPAPLVEDGKLVAPKPARTKAAKPAAEGEQGEAERAPVLARADDEALDDIPEA